MIPNRMKVLSSLRKRNGIIEQIAVKIEKMGNSEEERFTNIMLPSLSKMATEHILS